MKGTFVAAILSLSLHLPTQAASTLALNFFGGGEVSGFTDFMAGWRFRTNSVVHVNALGFYDSGADGLLDAHQVGIWTDSGVLLTSATIKSGTASPLDGQFRFESVASTTLTANNVYRIAAYYGSTPEALVTSSATAITAPEITYLDRAYLLSVPTFQFPSDFNDVGLAANFGPTFTFNDVPEPSTVFLTIIALAALSTCRSKL